MQTLQELHDALSALKLCPVNLVKLYRHKDYLQPSVYAVSVSCPVNIVTPYKVVLQRIIKGRFKCVYIEAQKQFYITPLDPVAQKIYNVVESCETPEHLEACERIILNVYDDTHWLFKKLMKIATEKATKLCISIV